MNIEDIELGQTVFFWRDIVGRILEPRHEVIYDGTVRSVHKSKALVRFCTYQKEEVFDISDLHETREAALSSGKLAKEETTH